MRNLRTKEYALVDFTRRGWFGKDENFYKVEGTVFTEAAHCEKKKEYFETKGGKAAYTLAGRWDK